MSNRHRMMNCKNRYNRTCICHSWKMSYPYTYRNSHVHFCRIVWMYMCTPDKFHYSHICLPSKFDHCCILNDSRFLFRHNRHCMNSSPSKQMSFDCYTVYSRSRCNNVDYRYTCNSNMFCSRRNRLSNFFQNSIPLHTHLAEANNMSRYNILVRKSFVLKSHFVNNKGYPRVYLLNVLHKYNTIYTNYNI